GLRGRGDAPELLWGGLGRRPEADGADVPDPGVRGRPGGREEQQVIDEVAAVPPDREVGGVVVGGAASGVEPGGDEGISHATILSNADFPGGPVDDDPNLPLGPERAAVGAGEGGEHGARD